MEKFKKQIIVVSIAILACSSLFFVASNDDLMAFLKEMVPGSYQRFLSTSYGHATFEMNKYDCLAIKFVIPDEGINVLTDAEYNIGSHTGTSAYEISGFSKVLSYDPADWAGVDSFNYPGYSWEWCITDATTHQGGPVRCNPGETWYVMMKMTSSGWWHLHGSIDGYPEDTEAYISTGGKFVRATHEYSDDVFEAMLQVYGYLDEVFYVDFSYAPLNPESGEQITFTDESNLNLLESRQWLIDGTPVVGGETMQHTFEEEGDYAVTLIGISYEGSNLQHNKIIHIGEVVPPPPTENFDLTWIVYIALAILCIGGVYYGYKYYKKKKKL